MPQPKPVVQVPRVWDMTASDSRDDADTRREHYEFLKLREMSRSSRKAFFANRRKRR